MTTRTDLSKSTVSKTSDKPWLFKPGNKLGGRPKGSRNKLAEAFVTDLLNDWEVGGASAIQTCRLEDPSTYLRVVASLVPKELNIRDGESTLEAFIEQFDGQQLDSLIAGIIAIGTAEKGPGAKVKTITGKKPN